MSEKKNLKEGMDKIMAGIRQISQVMPKVEMNIKGKCRNEKDVKVYIPSFQDCSKLSCRTTLQSEGDIFVTALQSYDLHGKQYIAAGSCSEKIELWDLTERRI